MGSGSRIPDRKSDKLAQLTSLCPAAVGVPPKKGEDKIDIAGDGPMGKEAPLLLDSSDMTSEADRVLRRNVLSMDLDDPFSGSDQPIEQLHLRCFFGTTLLYEDDRLCLPHNKIDAPEGLNRTHALGPSGSRINDTDVVRFQNGLWPVHRLAAIQPRGFDGGRAGFRIWRTCASP